MAARPLRRFVALVVVCFCSLAFAGQRSQPAPPQGIAEPWPDADTMQAQRIEAETRPLFASTDVLSLTLSTDLKAINKDREAESRRTYPATLTLSDSAGGATLHVTLRTRGHFRLRATTCAFVPLRIDFSPDEVEGTSFDGQRSLKLVTHCQNDKEYEQYLLREYLVYRMLNVLTPRSFRARLVRMTYVQSTDGKPIVTRLAVLLEDDDDVARRMEGRIIDLPGAMFRDVDQQMLTLTMIFQYMIGNTDFSLYALHNIRLVRTPANKTYTVPYDFDLSGLVNTSYAIPHRALRLETVRERLYRGPCRPADEVEQVLRLFRARKAEMFASYDSVPELDSRSGREAKAYLEGFFRMIDNPNDVRRTFVDGRCGKQPTM